MKADSKFSFSSHKDERYYKFARQDLFSIITKTGSQGYRVLDIGCASGTLGASLKTSGFASEIIGIEIVPDIAEKAKQNLDHVLCGNIEDPDFINNPILLRRPFDYIICADVLEHLIDPWSVLNKVSQMLKFDGKLISSIPNIRHWSVITDLVFKGDWKYSNAGILDVTHLRFFTKKTALELYRQSGFECVKTYPNYGTQKSTKLNKMTLGICRDFSANQWIIVCQKQNIVK